MTDLPPGRLSAEEAWESYRARWQVGLLFEGCEGQGGLARSAGRTRERVPCEVLAKLMGQVVANWAALTGGGSAAAAGGGAGPTRRRVGRAAADQAGAEDDKRTPARGLNRRLRVFDPSHALESGSHHPIDPYGEFGNEGPSRGPAGRVDGTLFASVP